MAFPLIYVPAARHAYAGDYSTLQPISFGEVMLRVFTKKREYGHLSP